MFNKIIKNGMFIHLIHVYLTYKYNFYIASCIAIKLYSVNYFFWFGNLLNLFKNPRHNWVKQFIRFTDTGHIASFMILSAPSLLPVAHNVHFTIMAGYWLGKFAFNMKDADKLMISDIDADHMDLCTYIHHTLPYLLMLHQMYNQQYISCYIEYDTLNLIYTYAWLYSWFIFIYLPWNYFTGDKVYSILDPKITSLPNIIGFVGVIHLFIYIANEVGYGVCSMMY